MSQRHIVQDASGVVNAIGPNRVVFAVSNKTSPLYDITTGIPLNGKPGFITGALVSNPFGSAGSALYVNQGSVTSSQWFNLA